LITNVASLSNRSPWPNRKAFYILMPGENGTKQLVYLILKDTAACYFGVRHLLFHSSTVDLHVLFSEYHFTKNFRY